MFRVQKIWDFTVLALLGAGLVAVIVMIFGTPAAAMHETIVAEQVDVFCAPKGALETALEQGYGEKPVRQSFQDVGEGSIFTWWESNEEDPSLRTWSLTLTLPDGKTCLHAAGKMNWEPVVRENTDPSY